MRGHFTPHTEETKRRISMSKSGQDKTWKERLPYCFCGKQISRMDAKFCFQHKYMAMIGEKNPAWKGDNVSYTSLHTWIRKKLGTPKKCKHCKKDGLTGHKIHWANISGKYLRILTDWIRLCVRCHKAYDSNSFMKI